MPTIESTREGEYKAFAWTMFAVAMLCMVGAALVLQGLLLTARDGIYVSGPSQAVVAIGHPKFWGVVLIVIGAFDFAAGIGVLTSKQWARMFGVGVSVVAVIGQFPVFFGDHPLWSLMVISISLLIIYGLLMYGGDEGMD